MPASDNGSRVCDICGAEVQVRKDGTLRRHINHNVPAYRPRVERLCEGSLS